MTAETSSVQIAHGRPFTVDDLEGMPDDGNRYELIDGTLIVSPAPGLGHQTVVGEVYVALRAACPQSMHTLVAPFAVRPSHITELQPDVLVGRKEDFTKKLLPVAPVLAVEVFSPSSVLNDLNYKKAAYQRLGVPNYWVIDPVDPTLTAFELDDAGVYRKAAEVKGSDVFETQRPFPVRIIPADLLSWLAEEDPE
ncbi:Uma2 family endonuclease [Actinophytocola sp.]|uniref:Uma2 family endonuclease n=1 Tax=Actinophytocola sp. TaxID=1872138 RepID=UPI00389AA0C0